MAWRENLFPALLAGVPLHYREVTTRLGHRTVVHEYLGDRPPTAESMGNGTWRATIDVFLIGDNYLVTRNTLITALNMPGPWEFLHPTMGPIMVKLEQQAELRESVAEQGMVRIGQLSLVEAGLAFPAIVDATSRKLASLATAAAEVMVSTNRLGLLGAIDKVLDSVVRGLNKAMARLSKVNSRIGAVTGNMANVAAALNNLGEQRANLVQAPWQVLGGIVGIGMAAFNALGKYQVPRRTISVEDPAWGAVAVSEAAINDLATFETDASDVAQGVPEGGPQITLATEAHAELQLQVRTMAFVAGASIAGDLAYAGAADASKMMTVLAGGLSASMAAPGLPVLALEALADLKAATVQHLLEQQAELPRVVQVQVPSAMPAIVLAYELFGDAEQATALVERNKLGRPGAVPGGTVLEVLSDV